MSFRASALILLLAAAPAFAGPLPVKVQWGWSAVSAVPADYDGDGAVDLGVFDPAAGAWYVFSPSTGNVLAWNFQWGWNGSQPVPGDYDGDGAADLAVYYQDEGLWYAYSIATECVLAWAYNWGWNEAWPVPEDYNGDGTTDFAVYYPAEGSWYLMPAAEPEITDMDVLAVIYSNAVIDASNALPSEICRTLTVISTNNPRLEWRTNAVTSNMEVRVCAFMSMASATNTSYYQVGYTSSLQYVTLFVTAVPELRDFCRAFTGTNLPLRMKKLLCLPAAGAYEAVVEFWVEPQWMSRPSPDPEITDSECELDFRTNSLFSATSTNHINWCMAKMADYSFTTNVWAAYPWTRLGYTYDWAKQGPNRIGLSEFIIPGRILHNAYGIDVRVEVAAIVTNLDAYAETKSMVFSNQTSEAWMINYAEAPLP